MKPTLEFLYKFDFTHNKELLEQITNVILENTPIIFLMRKAMITILLIALLSIGISIFLPKILKSNIKTKIK